MDQATFEGILEWTLPIVIIALISRWTIAQILRAGK